jgi:hypothetical protein
VLFVSFVEEKRRTSLEAHQYAIPTTMAKSRSTKARTNSIIALEIGQRTIISQIPSMTAIATTPTTANAVSTPAGPDIARTSPVVVANPSPIVPPMAINFEEKTR